MITSDVIGTDKFFSLPYWKHVVTVWAEREKQLIKKCGGESHHTFTFT